MEVLVSIIIPVYNTEEYLPACLESLVTQTCQKIEIILVNDGSTDNSLSICEEYASKYPFIKVYSQENAGQGSARNLGISKCSGEYVTFVDSDDWVDREMVQKLYDNIIASDSRIAVCNYRRTYKDQFDRHYKIEEKISPNQVIDLKHEKKLLSQVSTFACGKLIKKEIFDRFELTFPHHFFEDTAMMPILSVLAGRISFIDDALYYYRNRTGSTSIAEDRMNDRIRCMDSFIGYFKKYGLYEAYEEQLKQMIEQRVQVNLRMAGTVLHQKYNEFADRQEQTAKRLFPDVPVKQKKICVIGSYNLMTVAKVVMNYEADKNVELYFGRESLISMMSAANRLNQISIGHEIPMKNKCLVNDFSKRLLHFNPSEFQEIDHIFIDLLEERFDIGVYEGEYFTVSDAFLEVADKLPLTYQVIGAGSEEWERLWKEACGRFFGRILLYVRPEQVVIVESKLSEQYIDEKGRHDFDEIDQIRKCNERLQRCYDHIKSLHPECKSVAVAQLAYYATNADFRHGCFPWHLGNMAYSRIGEYIKEVL